MSSPYFRPLHRARHACLDCGIDLAGEPEWKTYCRACFAQMKREEENARDRALLAQSRDLDVLRHRIAELERALRLAGAEIERLEKAAASAAPQRSAASPPPAPIDLALVTDLLRLCHPDRHGGSELSNRVTRTLLAMRR